MFPCITQPDIPPGGSWTYEFVAPKAGTTMYHTHSNTVRQLTRGLFGAFIVEPREGIPLYDREYTLLLHEINGFYTINGHSFPKALEDSLLKIKFRRTDPGSDDQRRSDPPPHAPAWTPVQSGAA